MNKLCHRSPKRIYLNDGRLFYANPYLLTDTIIQLYNDGDIKALKWMVL